MSRNYVDENGNLIQIAGKGVGVAEWGTPIKGWLSGHTTSATARIADCDGLLFYKGISTGAQLYEDGVIISPAGTSGDESFMCGIRKGHSYYGNPWTSLDAFCVFYPFKTNNNLQMVREKYSTDETVIGEWIDGKPLYRKVFVATNTNITFSYNWVSVAGITDVYMEMKNTIKNISNVKYFGDVSSNVLDRLEFVNIDGRIESKTSSGAVIVNLAIALEYTKTTD